MDTDVAAGFEAGTITLPPGIAALPELARAALALEIVHAAASRLGIERGWDQGALDGARRHVLDRRLRFRWEGPAKISPDRTLTAHPVFVLHDDGYGRATIHVRRRDDGDLVVVSVPALAFSTSAGFARSARTLRWRGKRRVEMVPYEGLSAGVGKHEIWRDSQGLLAVDLDDPATRGEPVAENDRAEVAPTDRIPAVVVRTYADREPVWLEVGLSDIEGLRPQTDADDEYYITQVDLAELAGRSEQWRAWWRGSGLDALEFRMHFTFGHPEHEAPTRFRRHRGKLRVSGTRDHPGFASNTDTPPRRQARDDLQALIDLAGEHLKLPIAPRLPDPPMPSPETMAIRRGNRRPDLTQLLNDVFLLLNQQQDPSPEER
ncbi:hypothetical protein [Paractinoplanes tereljensis]|nr:hypothetical protein [Actinoplanes tereljensis]